MRRERNEMFPRVVSGIFAAALGGVLIYAGGPWLLGTALAIGGAATYEATRLARRKGIRANYWISIPGTGVIAVLAYLGHVDYLPYALLGITVASLITHVVSYGVRDSIAGPATTVLSSSYVGLPVAFLLLLRGAPQDNSGLWYTFFAITVVIATDTGAYFTGLTYGRRKLCPAISPNKTIEGAAGGLLAGVFAGLLANLVARKLGIPALPWSRALVLGAFVSIFGEAGDLVESAIKRDAGVKDSGVFLPGHGGVLDRFDSILFGIVVVYYYVVFFGQ